MGVEPKIRGILPSKWMVKIMENPVKMDDLGVPSEPKIFPNICGDFNGDEYHGIESVKHHKKKTNPRTVATPNKIHGGSHFPSCLPGIPQGVIIILPTQASCTIFRGNLSDYDKF